MKGRAPEQLQSLAEEARAASDGIQALERVVRADRGLGLRAALTVTRRALAVAEPRPRHFVTAEHERTWEGDDGCVEEALGAVVELIDAIEAEDAEAERAARARCEQARLRSCNLQQAIAMDADAFDYDPGSLVMLTVCGLLEGALGDEPLGRVVEQAAWLVVCEDEAELTRDPAVWDLRRSMRARALRHAVAQVVLDLC